MACHWDSSGALPPRSIRRVSKAWALSPSWVSWERRAPPFSVCNARWASWLKVWFAGSLRQSSSSCSSWSMISPASSRKISSTSGSIASCWDSSRGAAVFSAATSWATRKSSIRSASGSGLLPCSRLLSMVFRLPNARSLSFSNVFWLLDPEMRGSRASDQASARLAIGSTSESRAPPLRVCSSCCSWVSPVSSSGSSRHWSRHSLMAS